MTSTFQLRTTLAIFGAALSLLAGCDGGSTSSPDPLPVVLDPYVGRWKGTIPAALGGVDLHVTADFQGITGAPGIYQGSVSTDAPRCFTSAMISAQVTNGALMLNATGSGSRTQFCNITITGDGGTPGDGGSPRFQGLFSMFSPVPDDCNVDSTPFSFERQ